MDQIALGYLPFQFARAVQDNAVEKRIAGRIPDFLFTAEHPATVTLGKNFARAELGQSERLLREHDIEICETDRGGKATFHGPGQLVLYPVFSLRERGWGVKKFVASGLEALATVVRSTGLDAAVKLEPAGVWVKNKKIAAVGLRVCRGVTNHGFSLNVNNSLDTYALFSPCGLRSDEVCSLAGETGHEFDLGEISARVYQEFRRVFV